MPNSRADLLALLGGAPLARTPVFSGLPSLTAAGLRAVGVSYSAAHTDAALMAAAAASTSATYGFESAVVPFDLCVEAEALGCTVDFQTDNELFLAPIVIQTLSWDDWPLRLPADLLAAGRIPLVARALRLLKADLGDTVTVAAWLPGPFTLAWQLFGAEAWLAGLTDVGKAVGILELLADMLGRVGCLYSAAGADFLTVHEMGGSPQVIGAKYFRSLVVPALARLFAALPPPRVLSICGATDDVVTDMAATGAEALHVDQRNDLARTRQVLGPAAVILGNFDPVQVLAQGTPASVARTVRQIFAAGASAIWPGCDLLPDIPDENFRALMRAAQAPA